MLKQQHEYAMSVCRVDDRRYWLFRDQFYWDNENLQPAEVHALLVTRHQRQRQQVDRAQQMVSMGQEPRPTRRGASRRTSSNTCGSAMEDAVAIVAQ